MLAQEEFESLFTGFGITGTCVMDIEKVCKVWNNRYWIARYENTYRLLKTLWKDHVLKANISSFQAMEIIKQLDLIFVEDFINRHAGSYRAPDYVRAEIDRLNTIKADKYEKIRVIKHVVKKMEKAINTIS